MIDEASGPLEHKFCQGKSCLTVTNGTRIEGYASVFEKTDQGGDVVARGAYSRSLQDMARTRRTVKMLWQHDPAQPIGVWDEVREDERGLYVSGRLLSEIARAREAAALIEAGAIDGLSIGYRTRKSVRDGRGRRLLSELDLWEVSLVTFPMHIDARVDAMGDRPDTTTLHELAAAIEDARRMLASH
ncbi:HK97 family phage prohead protease [Roseitranquillus sediminis]|uniref:HK97 family phage prohead protease n=1 Tax=Roseitranquillus sediminis TaxID=2809051 RepID=UPI001D0C80CB|nr:HK97 family phage prohead protease [Roseitranquillus sediminis]MBM9595213.1 HK97 family phage prohead protease [Roseitranquillus sediminis]